MSKYYSRPTLVTLTCMFLCEKYKLHDWLWIPSLERLRPKESCYDLFPSSKMAYIRKNEASWSLARPHEGGNEMFDVLRCFGSIWPFLGYFWPILKDYAYYLDYLGHYFAYFSYFMPISGQVCSNLVLFGWFGWFEPTEPYLYYLGLNLSHFRPTYSHFGQFELCSRKVF